MENLIDSSVSNVAGRFLFSSLHDRAIAVMKFLSSVAKELGVAEHVFVVGGAVRNYLMGEKIKDADVVLDSIAIGHGRDANWFAREVAKRVTAPTNVTTNQYGVGILTIKGPFVYDGQDLNGEIIEVANARKESYTGDGFGKGKGYKPTDVQPATIQEDILRRDFTVNTLLWRLLDLAEGPDKAEVIDLTGLGRQHVKERLLDTPLDPDRTFSDDPTRILRLGKFFLKYGLKPSSAVVEAIRRNAHKLQDMPWEAVGNILVRDLMPTVGAAKGLKFLKDFGILPSLVEMVQKTPPFAAYLTRQVASGNHDVDFLLDLADENLEPKALGFLSPAQRVALRSLASSMGTELAKKFLAVLKSPPVDSLALIEEFRLQGRDRGALVPMARVILLDHPELMDNPQAINSLIRQQLQNRLGDEIAGMITGK